MGKKKSTQTTTNVVNVPAWLDEKNKALISRVDALSQNPYVAYTGDRVAGFTPDQLAAFNLVRAGEGDAAARGAVANQGVLDLFKRAQGPTSEDIQGLMNPYLEQVLGLTKRNEAESQAEAMARLKQESALAGSFGGSRFAIEKAQQEDRNQKRLSDIDYTGRFDAYNNALNQFNQGSNVMSEAIGRSLDVSNNDPSMKYAQALLGIGGQQQAQDQANLDVDYQDFLTEQQYPYQQAQWAQSFLQPYTETYKGSTSTATTKQSGGALQQLAGLGMAAASAYMGNPAGVSSGLGMAGGGGDAGFYNAPGTGVSRFASSLFGNTAPSSYATALARGQQNPRLQGPGFKDGGPIEGYANGGGVAAADEEFMKKREAIRNNNVAALIAPASALPADVTPNATGYVSDPDAVIAPDGEIPYMPLSANGAEDMSYLLDTPRISPPAIPAKDSPKSAAQIVKDFPNAGPKPEAFVPPAVAAPAPAVAQTVATQSNVVPDYAVPELKVTEDYIKQLIGESKKPVDDGNYQKYNFLGYEGQIYMPMFKAGLAMMASDGDFFEALAAGGNAFAGQLEQSGKSKAEKEADRLKALGLASEAERGAMQTQSNRIQVNKMNSDKVMDPITARLKEEQARKLVLQNKQLVNDAMLLDPMYGKSSN